MGHRRTAGRSGSVALARRHRLEHLDKRSARKTWQPPVQNNHLGRRWRTHDLVISPLRPILDANDSSMSLGQTKVRLWEGRKLTPYPSIICRCYATGHQLEQLHRNSNE
ncbi:hypothetical protein X797_011637 [Metarhizium robertsii]|uniref:Uncharacterized protein n=1 Tax=Metarhizium robertsii TaxID=568076 RepID=A0A014PI57_9HYPO|nr:hypothetical protein X797_011637 [Metarhizium robertsii]